MRQQGPHSVLVASIKARHAAMAAQSQSRATARALQSGALAPLQGAFLIGSCRHRPLFEDARLPAYLHSARELAFLMTRYADIVGGSLRVPQELSFWGALWGADGGRGVASPTAPLPAMCSTLVLELSSQTYVVRDGDDAAVPLVRYVTSHIVPQGSTVRRVLQSPDEVERDLETVWLQARARGVRRIVIIPHATLPRAEGEPPLEPRLVLRAAAERVAAAHAPHVTVCLVDGAFAVGATLPSISVAGERDASHYSANAMAAIHRHVHAHVCAQQPEAAA